MQNIDDLSPRIFTLLSEKDFGDLSSSEKELIQKSLSRNQYDEFRLVIKDFQELDNIIKVEVPVLSKNRGSIHRIFMHSIPVYQAAACVLIAVLLGLFIGWKYQSTSKIKAQDVSLSIPLTEEDYPEELVVNI